MSKENLVMYHGNCSDGTFSAWCAYKKFGDNAVYQPMFYNPTFTKEDLPSFENKNVYIFDFSFEPEIIEYIQLKAKSFILLDHHEGAYHKLKCCKNCFFDLKKSGAMLAWNYFFPEQEPPKFIKYVQDGDLFKFEYEETKPFYRSFEADVSFEIIDSLLIEENLNKAIENGRNLNVYYNSLINSFAKEAIEVEICGVKGYMVNAPGVFASELGNKLALESNTYCVVWQQKADIIKCSIRSVSDFDCSAIAEQFKGGGHKCASAYSFLSFDEFINHFKRVEKTLKNKI